LAASVSERLRGGFLILGIFDKVGSSEVIKILHKNIIRGQASLTRSRRNKLVESLRAEGNESVTKCHQLKMQYSDIEIRKAKDRDIFQLIPLMEQFGGVDKKAINSAYDGLFVADSNGKLAGYAWVQSYGEHLRSGEVTARFNDLFVQPDFRQHGVGKNLFEIVKNWSKKNLVSEIYFM